MKPCSGCRRQVTVTWAIDGTDAALCLRCIRRYVRDAEQEWVEARMRRIFGPRP